MLVVALQDTGKDQDRQLGNPLMGVVMVGVAYLGVEKSVHFLELLHVRLGDLCPAGLETSNRGGA